MISNINSEDQANHLTWSSLLEGELVYFKILNYIVMLIFNQSYYRVELHSAYFAVRLALFFSRFYLHIYSLFNYFLNYGIKTALVSLKLSICLSARFTSSSGYRFEII